MTLWRTALASADLPEDTRRWGMLGLLCLAVVLSLTTWFSATAITAELKAAWRLSGPIGTWLTNGVQIGIVAGPLAASLVTCLTSSGSTGRWRSRRSRRRRPMPRSCCSRRQLASSPRAS